MIKFLKIAALLGLATLVTSPVVRAQDQNPPAQGKKGGRGGRGMNPEQRLAAIDTAVSLTAEQKPKVQAILEQAQKDSTAAREAANGDMQAAMGKMREINTKANADIRALLTPEQQTKFDEMPQPGRGGRGKKKDN